MGSPNGAHASWEQEHVVLGDSDSPYALRNLNLAIISTLVAHKHTGNAAAQCVLCLFSRSDVKIAPISLFEIYRLVCFQQFRIIGRRKAR